MNQNVGGIDRVVRMIAGLMILSLFFVVSEDYRWWALVGLVPLLTGALGWCPAYLPFGIRTCKIRGK
ncbi:MAG TPA: DUF2892 domain-containing protein [Oxalobacteraceae bacterium]|jgi:hypothetical protein|nr:DUF2892 domain-containing protein [Oxalobacteraceae bacterium]HCN91050.1 DUF2892 domain-containing protein [Oxalobacteraceae bacterium]